MTKTLAIRRGIALALAAFSGLTSFAYPAVVSASSFQSADHGSFVLFKKGERSSTVSGSMEDIARARALREGAEGLLYVRQGGATYVIRDAATLRRAEAIFEPQKALGARQAELGSRQAALGARQAALGVEQGRLGLRQAGASERTGADLGRRQAALGQRQNLLGEQQNALGVQQAALGREQARLAREADAKLRALLADALRSGIAQRVN